MRTRSARSLPAATVTVAAVTGTMALAPAASAQTPEPTPTTSITPLNVAETGGVTILKKDPGGAILPGATFTLLDSTGQQAASGKTDADGQLAFKDLAPGVYRLKEVSSGSPLHDVVDDQDVIVTPGADAPLTIIDPFKPASLLLKARDGKSGKPLAGSTVNIGTGDKTVLTLTTGPNGTATAQLPVNSRSGTSFWGKQIKAPAGYDLYKPSRTFTAKPGDSVTVTITNDKPAGTTPKPNPSQKPSDKPNQDEPTSDSPTLDTPGKDGSASSPSASASDVPVARRAASSTSAPAAEGTLAHTGADATPWLLGSTGLLIAAGGGAVLAARRRRPDGDVSED